jgi:hypothetical protein
VTPLTLSSISEKDTLAGKSSSAFEMVAPGSMPAPPASVKEATIERRVKRYGDWAGLAFWLYLARGWVEDGLPV